MPNYFRWTKSLKIAVGTLVGILSASVGFAQSPEERFVAAATSNRLTLDYDGCAFSGPAWDRLVEEGRDAGFFLIGEEHGIAENARLAAQLFTVLARHGYSKLAIEISPPMALIVDRALKQNGIDALRKLYATPGGEPAFFGMQEEAELLVAARNALPDADEVLWGVDYEIASDRPLIETLRESDPPRPARPALDALASASATSWALWAETGSPRYIFSFAGDPRLVAAVRDRWPRRDAATDWILDTLESTLVINQLWVQGENWASNARRATLLRENFLRHWARAAADGRKPRVMLKAGASHLVRGRNMTGTFDLGTLLPELAALNDARSVSMLVLPGAGAMTAAFDPSTWRYEARLPKDGYRQGLELLTNAAFENAFTLFDLTALRPAGGSRQNVFGDRLLRVIHGFDYLLVMNGSTPSGQFEKVARGKTLDQPPTDYPACRG